MLAWIIPGMAVLCLLIYLGIGRFKSASEHSEHSGTPSYSELMEAAGGVRVLRSGQAEWRPATAGMRLMDGDLIQTDAMGKASIRYPNGTVVSIQADTVLAVQRTGSNEMEILMPQEPEIPADSGFAEATDAGSAAKAKPGELRPTLNLQRIIPFGRSLEIIGHVEPGSSLTVNDETVEVGGDGSFKHFTNPFPKSAEKVQLVLKATNLAGKASILTAIHDFSSPGGGN